MMRPAIVFLHIPKTAGQSVHRFLAQLAGKDAVAPCRVNHQLYGMSIADLRKYTVFSGHLDWSLLDCVREPRFIFTVLRNPIERILSFYFFLRAEAAKLSDAELSLPENQGKHAALHLSPDDYFTGGKPHIRIFLDNHYDNFYMYYFAGRTYDSRQRLSSLPTQQVMRMALDNLMILDGVYAIDALDRFEDDVRFALGSREGSSVADLRLNRGGTPPESRMDELKGLGATEATFSRLKAMTQHDEEIWLRFNGRSPSQTA